MKNIKVGIVSLCTLIGISIPNHLQAQGLYAIYSNHNVQTNLNVMRQHNLESKFKNANKDKDHSSQSSEQNYEESAKNDVAACDKRDHFIAPPLIWYAIKGC